MAFQDVYLISVLTWLPLVGAILVSLIPSEEKGILRWFAFGWSLLVFGLSLILLVGFNDANPDFQFTEKFQWIASLGISYAVGIDGISLWLVILTTFLTPLVILSAFGAVEKYVKGYMFSMLFLETAMMGALVAMDLFLFYVFWEMMLIPMYFLIGVWGGEKRIYATIKFFLFTMFGSLLMLVALIWVYLQGGGTSYLPDLFNLGIASSTQLWLFAAFALAFAIKVPMFPFHTWLPDAHTEAPTGGSVILAGVLLKMGTYGFLRFAIPLFPQAAYTLMPVIAVLAMVGILYGALVAMVQKDVKRLVAYSSVSHLGFVMLGIAAMNVTGVKGAIYQMLNHGVSTGALFLLVGVIYERRHTRLISEFGGLTKIMPFYAAIFMISMLSSVGLPGLNGFVGEFMIMLGAFTSERIVAGGTSLGWILTSISALGVLFAACYLLWMFQRVMFGPVSNEKNKNLKDLTLREVAVLMPLVILMFVMGLFPNLFLDKMEASVNKLTASYVVQAGLETAASEPAPDAVKATRKTGKSKPAIGRFSPGMRRTDKVRIDSRKAFPKTADFAPRGE